MMISALCKSLAAFAIFLMCAVSGIAGAADAEIVLLIGKGEVRESDTSEWKPARVQQQLTAGASVRTGEGSQMALLLKGETQVRVNQLTTLRLSTVMAKDETVLDLVRGRIWAQVKRVLYQVAGSVSSSRAVKVQSSTATIGIRGTDWDVEVGENGKTTVTVLSGIVEMSNEFGQVSLGSNEQATAEAGKPPIKQLLTNARDRVQWVTAYRPDPRRWVTVVPAALETTVQEIEASNYGPALRRLEALTAASPEATLILSDLYLFFGRAGDALARLSPLSAAGNTKAIALQGRALVVAGRLDDARTLLEGALARQPAEIEIALALADVARLEGNADEALRLFSDIVAAQPNSHEAWFGIGRIQHEKEDLRAARQALDTAIRLAPGVGGYHGERATLEVTAGNFAAANSAFTEALKLQPDDYLAWTGLGILQLKTGQNEAALESFLKAGVLEPRFARAQLYTGVAFYRLDNRERADEALRRAAALDPKDPLPHVMLGLIHGDALELREATDAAREAQVRMPFLRSLNPVANNQRGSANVGSALAAQGMDEWAQSYAMQSYNPFWAGSPLFLADRYPDGFNKNTEFYKGFLQDPTVFGASNRNSSLVTTPGHYGSIAYLGTSADFSQQVIQGKLNGLTATDVPVAYSVTGEYADGRDSFGPNSFQADGNNLTVGLGARPSHDLGLFYFGNKTDVSGHFSDPALLPDANLKVDVARQDAGFRYRFGPTNQILFKLGGGSQETRLSGSQIDAANAAGLSIPGFLNTSSAAHLDKNDVNVDQSDIQLRHIFEARRGTHISWGYEYATAHNVLARGQTFTATLAPCVTLVPLALTPPGCVPVPRLYTDVDSELRSTNFYLSGLQAISDRVDLQLDLYYQYTSAENAVVQDAEIVDARPGGGAVILPRGSLRTQVDEREAFHEVNPRIGARFSPGAGQNLRVAYQRWRRPYGTGSLGNTETVGIPIEDRLVDSGGLLKRVKARFDWEVGNNRFIQLSADHREVDNIQSQANAYFREFGLTELAALKTRRPVFDQPFDEFEATPVFSEGKISSGGAVINWLLTNKITVASRYTNYSSENTSVAFAGRDVPLIPRHFFDLAGFSQLGGRWLFGASATYRSSRYQDEANLKELTAGWNFGMRLYWETSDKKWTIEAAAKNLHSDKSSAIENSARLEFNSIYRF